MKTKDLEAKLQTEWERGYVAAVANLIRTHHADVFAKDVLRGAGSITWKNIAREQIALLKKTGVL